MTATNTRRWPRYHVNLPVFIAADAETTDIVVPGMVCELSRSGMELYAGIDLQPGDQMEVEFQTSGKVRVTGVVRYRSGFCFGVELCAVQTQPADSPDTLESLTLAKQEAYLRGMQQKIHQSLQAVLEMKKARKDIGSRSTRQQ